MDNQNQQPIPVTPPVAEPTEQKTYNKRHLKRWIILYVVLAIAVYGGVYAFMLSRQSQNMYSSNYPQPTTIAKIPTAVPTVELNRESTGSAATANWKTYADLNTGFSISYPSSWTTITSLNDTNSSLPNVYLTPDVPKDLSNSYGIFSGVQITVNRESENNKCVDAQTYGKQRAYVSYRTLSIESGSGIIVDGGFPGAGAAPGPEAYIANCPTWIYISLHPENIKNNTELFNQMLSTIKLWKPKKLLPG